MSERKRKRRESEREREREKERGGVGNSSHKYVWHRIGRIRVEYEKDYDNNETEFWIGFVIPLLEVG